MEHCRPQYDSELLASIRTTLDFEDELEFAPPPKMTIEHFNACFDVDLDVPRVEELMFVAYQ